LPFVFTLIIFFPIIKSVYGLDLGCIRFAEHYALADELSLVVEVLAFLLLLASYKVTVLAHCESWDPRTFLYILVACGAVLLKLLVPVLVRF
jgi:hypothetical protein